MLFDTDGRTLLSSVQFGPQVADVSNGTLTDGKAQPLVAYKTPTPAESNSKPCDSRGYWPLDWSAHRIDLRLALFLMPCHLFIILRRISKSIYVSL